MIKKCYHCDLPLKNNNYTVNFQNKNYTMCCPGCSAVFKFITSTGFSDYYKNREMAGNNINTLLNIQNYNKLKIFDKKTIQKKFLVNDKHKYNNIILAVDGINCSACTWLIERHIGNLNGIKNIYINLATCRVNITWNKNIISLSKLLYEFQKIGYIAQPYNLKNQEKINDYEYKNGLKNLIISGLGMMQVMMLSFALYMGEFNDIQFSYWSFIRWMSFIITTPVLFISGQKILLNALKNIKNKILSMDFTISLSLILAYIASIKNLIYNNGDVYFDSICMFIFFLLIARFLEMRSRHHATAVIYSLQELKTDFVRKIFLNKITKYVSIEDLKINDHILVQANEIIPVDGIIIDGCSNIDESMITGEFNPICKFKGNHVLGGTLNLNNKLIIKITHTIETSKITLIIKLLEQIGSKKQSDVFIINIISKYFVLAILFLTGIVTFIWIQIGHNNILNIILSMLVITCPCALSLSVPVAITTSINALSKIGFIITNEDIFEKVMKVKNIVFDKTGTLTINKYYIKKIKLFRNISIKKISSLTHNIEKNYNHPISKAFININKNFLYKIKDNDSQIIKHYISKGLKSKITKNIYKLGNINFVKKNLKTNISFIKKINRSIIILTDSSGILTSFNLLNPLRKNSNECINKLKKLNFNIHLLTGDNSNKVNDITKILDIKKYKKGCTVEDKIKYINKLKKNNNFVIMIGDGINDAPALRTANISIAMGSGEDITKINSHAILLNNNLMNIYKAIKHSSKTTKIIKQNIFWAVCYNFIGLLIASIDLITPYYAAIGMSLSSLLVVFNSLRLGKI